MRAELLDQLIPAVIRARPPTRDPDDPLRPWRPDDVRRWLSRFARRLDGLRDLLWWHLLRDTLLPLMSGPFGILVFFLVELLPAFLVLPISLVLSLALADLLGNLLFSGPPDEWKSEPVVVLVMVSMLVLVGVLAFGLVKWIETPSAADRAGIPRTTYRSDRTIRVIQIALCGLVGVLAGVGFANGPLGLSGIPVGGLMGVLVGGLAFGLADFVARLKSDSIELFRLTSSRDWVYFVLVARWLAVTGRLPWRLMRFLDDAYRLGLLRMVGPAYQFRHAELQDHLADTPNPAD